MLQTPLKRVMSALRGEPTDLMPLTIYECFTPLCKDIDALLARGLGIVNRLTPFKLTYQDVEIKSVTYQENGKEMIRTEYKTPCGNLSTIKEQGQNTFWTRQHLFKGPEDYKALKFLFQSRRYTPYYDEMQKCLEEGDERIILRGGISLEPLQELITSDIMDCLTFSYEWQDNRDELLALYEINAAQHVQLYEIAANSPASHFNYGGNVIPQIIGPEVFEKYYLPHYNLATDMLHAKGKLIGTHLDGDNTPIMHLLGDKLKLDYIEAYDPSVSPGLEKARQAAEGKALWLNWPSGEHYRQGEEIRKVTRNIVSDYGKGGKLIVGITEDMPDNRYDELVNGILDGLGY